MKLEMIRENPDGSADYTFDLTEDEKSMLIRLGIIKALEEAIKNAEQLVAPEPTEEELKQMNEETDDEDFKAVGGTD
jgi:hypothetical protein